MKKCLCKVCGITDDSLFYSSIATYCKEHWKEKVKANRNENADYYKAFDRNRANLPHRVEARESYQKTIAFKESHEKANEKYRETHPKKKYAQGAISRAVKKGIVIKTACFVCGSEKVEAHHPDYSSPLDVIWMCDKHHKETHVLCREILRNKRYDY